MLPRMPKWIRRLRAIIGGYFWIPCPICGRMFGGYEWRDRSGKDSSILNLDQPITFYISSGKGICPWCTVEGRADWYVFADGVARLREEDDPLDPLSAWD